MSRHDNLQKLHAFMDKQADEVPVEAMELPKSFWLRKIIRELRRTRKRLNKAEDAFKILRARVKALEDA